MNRILLADPNPTLCSALALLLKTRLDAQIVGQVGNMENLLCEAAAGKPDIIIIGQELPGEPSQERIAALRQVAPLACILISSVRSESVNLTEDRVAFLCQADPPETILQTIQTFHQHNLHEGIKHV